ncbi:MAG: cysteine--tRNA ligase [Candidatus Omnitrophota bacterium]
MLKIFNSLTRSKEPFVPKRAQTVEIYACGVTVYDDCHIGHARSLYVFEVIRRYLNYRGYKVKFIRNITDIDDKIINRANQLNINWRDLVNKYISRYYEDLKALGISKADQEPRATENIKDMIKYIQGLINKGCAYVTESGVYFSVRKFKGYGKLSGQSVDQMREGVRIKGDEAKVDALDFALWKKAKQSEPSWPSPWGKGRPGWHIECSVMSRKFLRTDTLDIHGGGRDLIFPHHENERAQAESLTNKTFANFWIHHGLLTIDKQKMAKSLGNFVTIKGFMDKYRDSDLLKLFFLSAHYSHSIDYNQEKIEEVKKQKKSFYDFFDKTNSRISGIKTVTLKEDIDKIDAACAKFHQAMDDDFNTPRALASLFELVDLGSGFVSSDKETAFNYIKSKLEVFFKIFGLKVKKKEKISSEQIKMAKKRLRARAKKDFKTADVLRKKIEDESPYYVTDSATSTMFVAKKLPEEDNN